MHPDSGYNTLAPSTPDSLLFFLPSLGLQLATSHSEGPQGRVALKRAAHDIDSSEEDESGEAPSSLHPHDDDDAGENEDSATTKVCPAGLR